MPHLSSDQLIDAARGLLDHDSAAAAHLATGCARCTAALGLWTRFAESASADVAYEPPADVVRVAQSYIFTSAAAPSRPAGVAQTIIATLLFDTLEHALPDGVRSGAARGRHLLYQAQQLSVDVQLDTIGPPERIMLSGQVMGAVTPAQQASLVLLSGDREIDRFDSTPFGEFHCEFERRDDLSLTVTVDGHPLVRIPLDRLPGPAYPSAHSPNGRS